MIRHDVPVCQCDECGHRWIAETGAPDRCPSRKCRSTKWDANKGGKRKRAFEAPIVSTGKNEMLTLDQVVDRYIRPAAQAYMNKEAESVAYRPKHAETCKCLICKPPK